MIVARRAHETWSRLEVFSYLEVDSPFQRSRRIIGTQTWAYKFGAGAIKGFSFGTLTGRVAGEYDEADKQVVLGEYAIDYLKRSSPKFRFYTGMEGDQDEVEWIVEGQYRLGRHAYLKLNTAFGLTPKAPDFAPEIGIMFSFRPKCCTQPAGEGGRRTSGRDTLFSEAPPPPARPSVGRANDLLARR